VAEELVWSTAFSALGGPGVGATDLLVSAFIACMTGGGSGGPDRQWIPYKIRGTTGLQHSFGEHADQWFGGEPKWTTHGAQWLAMIEWATQSKLVVNWAVRGKPTIGHLAYIDGKYFFVQFYKTGSQAGELATAFVPTQRQLHGIRRQLGHLN
jgi:hypothetical protein